MAESDNHVLVWREARAGRIRLNRPKALNVIDLPMVTQIRAALAAFEADPSIHLVLIDAPERGFCAGGDVKRLISAIHAGNSQEADDFFAAEYAMDQAVADYRKPIVSLIDGVCMGGGVGLSIHGSHRIATEAAIFAMPETAIALFPDVGMTFVLPRMPGALGVYLGLTGARLSGADAVHAGFATHFVPQAKLKALEAAVLVDGVAVIAGLAAPLPEFSLAPHRPLIDKVFSAETIAELVGRLREDSGAFAQETLELLRQRSPLSVHWSFHIIRQGANRDLRQALAAEFELVRRVTRHPEFQEGVRALLLDRDRNPRWSPATLEEVDPASLTQLFA
jgi:enoyl-CoA hydratase/carnithine racemase